MSSNNAVSAGTPTSVPSGRIDLLDAARGVALLAMLVYHFTWDLEFFGYLPAGTAFEGGWRLFARSIATSFLFLVGVGLVLAHARGIRWRSFWVREAQVVAGALAITVATLFVTPDGFVFFGILHQIAVASLLGLLFLRTPAIVPLLVGAAMIALPLVVQTDATNTRWLAWIGLSTAEPLANDLVPVFPWSGIVLLGMAAAKWAGAVDLWSRLQPIRIERAPGTGLTWIGRHSLAFYLIHQPVSIALIAAYAQVFPPDRLAAFADNCQRTCVAQQGAEALCTAYCGCVQSAMSDRDILDDFLDSALGESGRGQVQEIVLACSAQAGN